MTTKNRYSLGTDPARRRLHRSWHRGAHCRFTPSKLNLTEATAIKDYIVDGWAPPAPIIAPDANILAVGSCFAQYIAKYLRLSRRQMKVNDGSNVNVVAYGAGFVNTYTLLNQFAWALGEREAASSTLYVEDGGENEGLPTIQLMPNDEAMRARTRALIDRCDAFIITLGLSEVWYDRQTLDVFFGAVPSEIFDPERHAFRVTSVSENRTNLRAIVELIRKVRPEAPIVFTLSPVPLTATFRPVSCLTANAVSKSILRVAVDELMREGRDDVFYWPSYEVVTEFYGPHRAYNDDRRHVRPEVVQMIMKLFEDAFVQEVA